MQNVLLTGGSGLIGRALSSMLQSKGYKVSWLSRHQHPRSEYSCFAWDIDNAYIDEKAFENVDFIVHLAGAGIADKRWIKTQKKIIIDSRVASTKLLLSYIQKLKISLKAFISSSAIGFYGSVTGEMIFEENNPPGNDFIAKVCRLWEGAIVEFQKENIRTVAIRTGIVLSAKGGALMKMKTPVITPLGNGLQYMPWIHMKDLCSIYIQAIEDSSMNGVYNGVAPEHQNNSSFSKEFAMVFKRPFLPVGAPAFVLNAAFGEMSTILLNGSRVSSDKIQSTGFKFEYPLLKDALVSLR